MKELSGSASGVTSAPIEECVRFLRTVDRYPTWHPDVVRSAEVLERNADGDPTRARASLHVAVGPLVKDFNLVLLVTFDGTRMVKLAREPHGPADHERFEVAWYLEEGGGTRIRLQLRASLSVPRLVPVGGIGDSMAAGFVTDATRALNSQRG
jgi:hypothetical protein